MIVLNLPMTALSIRAEGDDPAKQYNLTCYENGASLTEGDETLFTAESTDTICYLDPGNISIDFNDTDFTSVMIDINHSGNPTTFTHNDDFELTHLVKLDAIEIGYDENFKELRVFISEVYKINWTSNIYRTLEFDDAQIITSTNGFNGIEHIASNCSRDSYSMQSGELYLNNKPESIRICNPGGVGGEDLLRFTHIYFNGSEERIQNSFDVCNYSIGDRFSDEGYLSMDLVGDDEQCMVIGWINDANENTRDYCMGLGYGFFNHGAAIVTAVYDENMNPVDTYDCAGCVQNGVDVNGTIMDGVGTIRVQCDYYVEFEFIPHYGYQLQRFYCNEDPQGTDAVTADNHYLFHVPHNNIHLSANFIEIPGQVISEDSSVESGLLQLPANSMDGGTGRVTVSDLDENTIDSYNIPDGYAVEEGFDIDLTNIYHMANRGEEYWETDPIHDPNGQTTVALTLNDDFEVPEGQFVQVFHQTSGDPEKVNTTYDPDTNTITFNTTGFSDFIVTTTNEPVTSASVPSGFYDQTMPDDPWGLNSQPQQGDPNGPPQDGPNDPQQGNQPQGHTEYVIAAEGSGFALRRNYDPDNTQNPTEFDLRDGDQIEDDAEIRFDSSVNRTSFEIVVDGDARFLFPDEGDSFCPNEWLVFEGIDISGDEPYAINFSRRDEPGEEPPHFFVGQSGNEYGLGGEYIGEGDQLIFEPFNIGENIPDDATINLSNEFRGTDTVVMISVDGNIVYVLSADEIDRGFVPGHWLRYDGVTEDNNGITVNFTTIWVIQIAGQTGFELTVVDEDGDPMIPNYAPDDFEYSFVTDFGFDEYGEPYTLTFEEMPYMAIVRPHNAVFTMLLDEDYEFIPYGDNEILYPADDDCGFAFIWHEGMPYIDADCIEDLAFDIDGLGEDDESMYAVTIREFDVTDLSEEEFAQFSDMAATGDYTDSMPLLGLEINLYKDGNEESIHDPGFTVHITLTLADPLELEDGEAIFIIHMLPDNEFEIIEATYDADEMTLTFEAGTFSPFVVCRGSKDETTTNNTTTNTNTNTTTTTNTPTPVAAPTATTPAETSATENKSDAKTEETSNPTPTPTTAPSSGTASTGEKAVSVSATIGLILILSAAAVAVYRKRSSAIGNDED